MKKTLIFYLLMILSIACLAIVGNIKLENFSSIIFSHKLHVTIETLISILLFLIFLRGKSLFSKTKDERFLILAYGFLIGTIFNLVHIFTVKIFPYDNLSFGNIEKNPTLIYLLFCILILPLSIYFSLIFKPPFFKIKDNFKVNAPHIYFYIFLFLALFPLLIYYLLPQFLNQSYILMHTLEYANYALYLMMASILINVRISSNQNPFNMFILGILTLGLGGLFYINPLFLPINSILAHISQLLGLLLILLRIIDLPNLSNLLRVKDVLVSYLSLLLIAFYIAFIPIGTSLFNLVIPQSAGYIFIEFLLFFQFIIYVFSTISWNKVANVYLSSERDKAMLRVFESMRRISNPNIIKNTVVNEIINTLDPDRCFIALYNLETNSFYYDNYSEFLPSKTLVNFDNIENEALEFEKFQNTFNNIEICFSNVDEYIERCSLKGKSQEKLLRDYRIKSVYSIPINYDNKLFGYLILQYKNEYKNLSEDDIEFLNKMAAQIGIVINKNE